MYKNVNKNGKYKHAKIIDSNDLSHFLQFSMSYAKFETRFFFACISYRHEIDKALK